MSFFKHEPPRSKLGYSILFYLPCLFLLSLTIMWLPYFASYSPLWGLVGIKMFGTSLFIYGSAEKYCLRSVMICSVARVVAPVLLGGWSVQSLTWPAFVYGMLETAGGLSTLLLSVTETVSPEMLERLSERTQLGGLDETIIMPTYTRAAVCLMSVLEFTLGFRCIVRPQFIEWIVSKPEVVLQIGNDNSFYAASVCFGTVTVITSSVLLVVVLVFKVAAMKWWVAAYHMNIALSIVPLRLIFGIPFHFTFLICAFHFVAGLTITILPSALEELHESDLMDRAKRKLGTQLQKVEKSVDKITGRSEKKKDK